MNELVEAADEKQLNQIARYGRFDVFCLDELGCMELQARNCPSRF